MISSERPREESGESDSLAEVCALIKGRSVCCVTWYEGYPATMRQIYLCCMASKSRYDVLG